MAYNFLLKEALFVLLGLSSLITQLFVIFLNFFRLLEFFCHRLRGLCSYLHYKFSKND